MALVCGKRNRFNFPIVYGQIFLLAKSAVNFFTGALCSLRLLCFQLLRLEQLPLETRAGCQEDTGQRGSSLPRHAALPKLFVPFPHSWGQTDRQTDRHRPESTSSTDCLLSPAPRAVPAAKPLPEEPAWHLSTGQRLERGRKIRDCPKVTAVGKKTLVQMPLILCEHPLEVTPENLLRDRRVSRRAKLPLLKHNNPPKGLK